ADRSDDGEASMRGRTAPTIEHSLGGTTTEYYDMAVAGDEVEQLLVELFTEHWAELTAGPLIEGAVYEIQFATPPKVTKLDGYLTVDTGAWHFHLCVSITYFRLLASRSEGLLALRADADSPGSSRSGRCGTRRRRWPSPPGRARSSGLATPAPARTSR